MNAYELCALAIYAVGMIVLAVDWVWRKRYAAQNAKWRKYYCTAVSRMNAEMHALRVQLQGGAK